MGMLRYLHVGNPFEYVTHLFIHAGERSEMNFPFQYGNKVQTKKHNWIKNGKT
jgi:hypothetical protein